MGFPSEGVEALYRNKMKDIQSMMQKYHKGHFKVYNLCAEKHYPPERFTSIGGQAVEYGFLDHNPPPFKLLPKLLKDMKEFHDADDRNVVVVHCKAGKGRTGTVCSAFLLYADIVQTADEALDHFAVQRTKNGKGVTIPSQKRYVRYFEEYEDSYLGTHIPFAFEGEKVNLKGFTLNSPPNYNTGGCTLYFVISTMDGNKIYDSSQHYTLEPWKDQDMTKFDCKVNVQGDLHVMFYDHHKHGDSKLFGFWIHTSFLNQHHTKLTLTKSELDKAVKDKHHKIYHPTFAVEMEYQMGWVKTDDEKTTKKPNILRRNSTKLRLDENPLIEGRLKKTAQKSMLHGGKRWRWRHFVLYPDVFAWSEKKGKKFLGVVPIQTIAFVKQTPAPHNQSFEFVVKGSNRTYMFRMMASTVDEANEWVTHLNTCVKAYESDADNVDNVDKETKSKFKNLNQDGKFWKNTVEILILRNVMKANEERTVEEEADSGYDTEEKEEDLVGPNLGTHEHVLSGGEEMTDWQIQSLSLNVLLEGTLRKKMKQAFGASKMWQERYFILDRDALRYYTTKGGQAKGLIPTGCISKVVIHYNKKVGCRFDVVSVMQKEGEQETTTRVYALLASDVHVAQAWAQVLSKGLWEVELEVRGDEPDHFLLPDRKSVV